MRVLRILLVLLPAVALLCGCQKKQTPADGGNAAETKQMESTMSQGWTLENAGLLTPESVYYDAVADIYYVSNLGGPQPLDKDGNGFISKLGPGGKLIALKWISGEKEGVTLNAPKGMAQYKDWLLVSDIDMLRVFEVGGGEHVMDIPLPGATFANDVWTSPGVVYVTDTGTSGPGAIYRIELEGHETPQVATLVRDAGLTAPNGIIEHGGALWMVPYGGDGIFNIHPDGTFEIVAHAPTGALDGVVALNDGRIAFSSWDGKAVYVMDDGRHISTLFSDVASPADIGYDRKRNLLLIPQFMEDRVLAKPVPRAATADGI